MIEKVHSMYLEAGADIIISSSYQATVDGFEKKGIDKDKALSLIALSVDLAVKARDEITKSDLMSLKHSIRNDLRFWLQPHLICLPVRLFQILPKP